MEKRHFERAAAMVRAIRDGEWTTEGPSWSDPFCYLDWGNEPFPPSRAHYTRAVQTAEAFILLFQTFSSRFDESRFLIACGLAEAPAKARRR